VDRRQRSAPVMRRVLGEPTSRGFTPNRPMMSVEGEVRTVAWTMSFAVGRRCLGKLAALTQREEMVNAMPDSSQDEEQDKLSNRLAGRLSLCASAEGGLMGATHPRAGTPRCSSAAPRGLLTGMWCAPKLPACRTAACCRSAPSSDPRPLGEHRDARVGGRCCGRTVVGCKLQAPSSSRKLQRVRQAGRVFFVPQSPLKSRHGSR
jgi:hypothetical protein